MNLTFRCRRRGADRGLSRTRLNMAERGGFEPPVGFNTHTRFPSELLKPLGHLSVGRKFAKPQVGTSGPRDGDGGEGGIRTPGEVALTMVFETIPFSHSGTSPCKPTMGGAFCPASGAFQRNRWKKRRRYHEPGRTLCIRCPHKSPHTHQSARERRSRQVVDSKLAPRAGLEPATLRLTEDAVRDDGLRWSATK